MIAGLARARVRGTKSGKPIGRGKISLAKERAIAEALTEGMGVHKTARLVKVGIGTVMRVKRTLEKTE